MFGGFQTNEAQTTKKLYKLKEVVRIRRMAADSRKPSSSALGSLDHILELDLTYWTSGCHGAELRVQNATQAFRT